MRTLLFLALLFTVLNIYSQPDKQWKNYTNPWLINNFMKDGHTLWAATAGGILKTDLLSGKQYVFTRASANLPSNNILSLTTDKTGKVWFITDSYTTNISVFSGWWTYNFSATTCPVRPGTAVLIKADNNGDIWVATNTDSIFLFSSNHWSSFVIPYDTATPDYLKVIRNMNIDHQNNVWLNTFTKIFKFNKNNWTIVSNSIDDSLITPYWSIKAMSIKNDNSVWCVTNRGLLKYSNGNWKLYPDNIVKKINSVDFCFDNNGIGWITGSYSSQPGQYTNLILKINDTIVSVFNDTLIWQYKSRIIADSGKIYLHGFTNSYKPGVYIIEDSVYNFISSVKEAIPSNKVDFVHISKKTNKKYILSANKLVVMENFLGWDTILRLNSSISDFTKRSMIGETSDGALWIAGVDSLIRIKNNKIYGYDYTLPSKVPFFISLEVDSSDVIWTSSMWSQNGLRTFDGNNWNKINQINPNDIFSALRFDKTGKLWLGTYGHGIYTYSKGIWTSYNYSWVMHNATISQILMGKNNDIWFSAQDKGIIHKNSTGIWKTYNFHNSGLVSDTVYDLAIDKNGILYIATAKGLNIFDGNSWDTITVLNSRLPSDMVYSITFDSVGNLWIGTNRGLAVYKKNGLALHNSPVFLSKSPLDIFPNPTNGQVYIKTKTDEIIDISVYDIQGRRLKIFHKFKSKNNRIKINLNDLKPDLYIIEIYNERMHYSEKIIVQ